MKSAGKASEPLAPACLAKSAERSEVPGDTDGPAIAFEELRQAAVMLTILCGDEGPDDGGVGFLLPAHATREASGLPDRERRTKLVLGVLAFDRGGLISGK